MSFPRVALCRGLVACIVSTAVTVGALLCFDPRALAGGTVTEPTEAALRAALVGGGTVTFACDGTITLTNTVRITIETTLDATGHTVTLSGHGATRILQVGTNVMLALRNLTLADGMATGGVGGAGEGAAIYLDRGTVTLVDCRLTTHLAQGSAGTNAVGGTARGGAIFNQGGTLRATNCVIAGNAALGGLGGGFANGGFPNGGDALAGALFSSNGAVELHGCRITGNWTKPGVSSMGAMGGSVDKGQALGGAMYLSEGSSTLEGCRFEDNRVADPGHVANMNVNTDGGGAVFVGSGTHQWTDCSFVSNYVSGTSARFTPGLAWGGAIWNRTTITMSHCELTANVVVGGSSERVEGVEGAGGAIYNEGWLKLVDTTFASNRATNSGTTVVAVPASRGGAIFNTNTLTVLNCTFTGNVASGPDGWDNGPFGASAGVGKGGAVYTTGTLNATNTTFSSNLAQGGDFSVLGFGNPAPAGDGVGGGVFNDQGVAVLNQVTFAGNSARGGMGPTNGLSLGSELFVTNGTVTLQNSILANSPSGSNVFGAVIDAGNNLSSDSTPVFTATGSHNNIDPRLGPLGDYGGPTPTISLLAGSPAIDAGNPAFCPPTDQRGHARPFGAACDIGAFEFYPPPPNVLVGTMSGNDLHLVYSGQSGQTVRWLISTNFLDWQPLWTNTVGADQLAEYLYRNATLQYQHFFQTASP